MTPLAQMILKDSLQPKKGRRFNDEANIVPDLVEAHCFEMTAVQEAAFSLGKSMYYNPGHVGKLAFLPAPLTWMEASDPDGSRAGILLREIPDEDGKPYCAMVRMGAINPDGRFGSYEAGIINLRERIAVSRAGMTWTKDYGPETGAMTFILYAQLALINTPRVVGRRQHMPHAGLQRRLAQARGMVGKFPLHAWHEVQLDIAPPRMDQSGDPHEARLTGAKALHFCRCHLRIRLGQLELVSAHWRGDPALGMKQTRYRLTDTAA